jgi:glucokinase
MTTQDLIGLPPVLALDIGGTKLAVAVVTGDGATHGLQVEPTYRDRGPDDVIARLFAMGHRAVAAAGLGPVAAVGISCGGPLDAKTGVLLCPFHLPGWINIPITAMAEAEYSLPAVLENDATAAALAEHRYGAGAGKATIVYLTISTGIGGGTVVAGKLHLGAAGNGGELGHITVRPGGRECRCGRRGCLEAYCSGTNISARAAEAAASRPSALTALDTITAADVEQAARAGDPVAQEVWDETTALLGQALTDIVNIIEPEAVILGGGVTRAGDFLVGPVRAIVKSTAMPPAAAAVDVVRAGLGDEVCVVGAGAIAHDAWAKRQGGQA